MDSLNTVYRYHDLTKHAPGRYARSLGYMDWRSQPDPFRRHDGAALTLLPRSVGSNFSQTWDGLFGPGITSVAPDNQAIGTLFYLSMALSAWKEVIGPGGEVTSRWALRVNPSSGNLHPTEAWLANATGVHHYRPDVHGLELTAVWPDGAWSAATSGLPDGTLIAGLSSIPWREAWKYGERAYRYCQHDAGHAMAALSLAARHLGWTVVPLAGAGDLEMAKFLGIADAERAMGPEAEHPDLLFALTPGTGLTATRTLPLPAARTLGRTPNHLSPDHHEWENITEVAEAVAAPSGSNITVTPPLGYGSGRPAPDRGLNAVQLIRRRRSAVAMDATTHMARDDFFHLLTRLLPAADNPAFDLFRARTAVSLVLMVHRVEDLRPGLYVLSRHPEHKAALQASTRGSWLWATPEQCPAHLPLFFLGDGDLRAAARQISCGQDIAADGVFSLGMLARFDDTLKQEGPQAYPELFRETGAVGQMLYLEAEAAGLGGTGIGCFFDDEMHRVLGITDHSWQSLYHFTVGGRVTDERLRDAPPYADTSKAVGD